MNDQSPERDATEATAASQPVESGSSQQRRRLLRAFGAGGAIVGAGLPFAAHATGRPFCKKAGDSTNNYHPTASAVGSIIGSVTANNPQVEGHSCDHYKNSGNWNFTCKNGDGPGDLVLTYSNCVDTNTPVADRFKFYDVFKISNPGSGPASKTCATVLSTYATSDEAIFLVALFNANKRAATFPYSRAGVLDLYLSKNPKQSLAYQDGLKAKARTLFEMYLSSKS